MTARKKPANVQRPAANSAAEDNEAEFDQETQSDIEQFLSGQSEQSTVSIYRIGKPGERDGFLDVMSATAMQLAGPEQILRDTYGAGNFRLRLKAPSKAGRLMYAGTKTITIAERAAGPVPGNGHGPAMGTEGYLREELNRQHSMLLAMIAANKPQTVDFTGIAAMIAALSGGNKQSDLGAVVQAFTMLKQSAEPGNGLAQVKDVLEIARSISGGPAPAAGHDEPDTSWGGILKGVLGAFSGAAAAGQPAPARRMIAAPAGAPQPTAGEEDEQPGDEEMFQQILAGQLQFLKTKVHSSKPVEWWIQYAIDNADETGNQVLFTALKGGATFEHLLQFDPTIATDPAVRVWFQKFYDGLRGSLQPATAIPWIVGNNANPAGNAVPGADRQSTPGDPAGSGNPGQP